MARKAAKFRVGDRVRVNESLRRTCDNVEMYDYIGNIFVISMVTSDDEVCLESVVEWFFASELTMAFGLFSHRIGAFYS